MKAENYGQHFLVDKNIIEKLVEQAELSKEDIVLDIGAGSGAIAEAVSKKAKVICVEIDGKFENSLRKIENAEVFIQDIAQFFSEDKVNFTKIVSNIPYDICDFVFRKLILAGRVRLALLVIPKSFFLKAEKNALFTSFLNIRQVIEVPKTAFYPKPKTSSVIAEVSRRRYFEEDKDEKAFIIRKLYLQEAKKLRNGLREAFIDLHRMKTNERMPMKTAVGIVKKLDVEQLLEKKISALSPEEYKTISNALDSMPHI